MAAPRKYPEELRERATRMAVDLRKDPATKPGALLRVGAQLGIHPETLRNWVNQAEIDAGERPGTSADDAQRLADLEREVRELRRANAILRSASAFFASVPSFHETRGETIPASCPRHRWRAHDFLGRRVRGPRVHRRSQTPPRTMEGSQLPMPELNVTERPKVLTHKRP
jgi:transposase